jgi:hypothetical protein
MMACVGFFLFFVFLVFLIAMERWWPLLGAIVRGNSKYLEEDILESGLCQDKRKEWAPPPVKSWWEMTPEEQEQERLRRRRLAEREAERKAHRIIPSYVAPELYIPPSPPKKEKSRKRDALDDLADEMFRELD